MTQEVTFQPGDQQDPAGALTLVLRGLRTGERVAMPDGTVVRSVSIRRGAHQERRFAIVPPAKGSTPIQRHRVMSLGRNTYRSAQEAAETVLGKR